MAHKKGVGSSKNGRESESKRLGVKIFGGQFAKAGNILIRQRGTKHYPGENVGMGKDHTLFALTNGTVVFRRRRGNRSYVSVEPIVDVETAVAETPVKKAPAKKAAPKVEEVKAEVKTPVAEVKEEVVAKPIKEKAPAKKTAPKVEEVEAEVKTPVAEVKEEVVAKPIKEKASAKKTETKADNLTKLDGVGPKLAEILNAAGITTYAGLAETSIEKMKEILEAAGSRYASKDPAPWIEQAKTLA